MLRAIWAEPFASEAIKRFRHTLDTGEPFVAERTVERRKDTPTVEAYDWRIERLVLPDGRFGVVCYFYDLSERQRWESAVRESEERLRLALAITRAGTFEIDLLTDAVEVNDTGRSIFGWSPDEELTYSRVQTQFHPDDRDEVMKRVGESLRPDGAREFEVEQRIHRIDGAVRWIRVRGRTFFELMMGREQAVRVLWTYLDVTDQKEEEHRREHLLRWEREARSDAERASRMKDEFLATLSHELRTPLTAILGWARILRQSPGHRDVSHGLETIERNARAQSQIVEDLLDMSRIISGKIILKAVPLDLGTVIRAAIETVAAAAKAKEIEIAFDRSTGLRFPVLGEAHRLQQVFWNLLSNAIKFTPRGGIVAVSVEQIHSSWRVDVVDSGEGIAPDFLPYVFDRFRQADASTTRRHGGLGLGLSIVKQIVELHGGRIEAVSEGAGRGATFSVSLPVMASQPPSRSGSTQHLETDERHVRSSRADTNVEMRRCEELTGAKVLVIDDEADTRSVIQQLLSECNVEVHLAANADEALAIVERVRPHVLVSDIGMPEVDGYGLLGKIRDLGAERGGQVPAIALTAYARAEDRVKAIRAGFEIHVPKPVEPDELISAVATMFQRSRA